MNLIGSNKSLSSALLWEPVIVLYQLASKRMQNVWNVGAKTMGSYCETRPCKCLTFLTASLELPGTASV